MSEEGTKGRTSLRGLRSNRALSMEMLNTPSSSGGTEENTSAENQSRRSRSRNNDSDDEANNTKMKMERDDLGTSSTAIREKIRRRERKTALQEPEVTIIGEIESGYNFGSGICLRWEFDFGETWQVLNGYTEGQTQLDFPVDGDEVVWCHPLDLQFLSKGMTGWPRLLLQVWKMDDYGSLHLCGYGFTHIPATPGTHEIEVNTWRPVGTLQEEISATFLGNTPQLRDMDLLFSKAWSDRCRLQTKSSGTVRIRLDIVTRNMKAQNVDV